MSHEPDLVRVYKVALVTAISEMVGMDGNPTDNQIDAAIEPALNAAIAAYEASKGVSDPEDTERLNWLSLNPRGAQIVGDGKAQDCIFWGIASNPENTLRQAIDAARGK